MTSIKVKPENGEEPSEQLKEICRIAEVMVNVVKLEATHAAIAAAALLTAAGFCVCSADLSPDDLPNLLENYFLNPVRKNQVRLAAEEDDDDRQSQ